MVYKRLKSRRSLLVLNFVEYSPPPTPRVPALAISQLKLEHADKNQEYVLCRTVSRFCTLKAQKKLITVCPDGFKFNCGVLL